MEQDQLVSPETQRLDSLDDGGRILEEIGNQHCDAAPFQKLLQFEEGPLEIGSFPERGTVNTVHQPHELPSPRRWRDEIPNVIVKDNKTSAVALQMRQVNQSRCQVLGEGEFCDCA